MLPQEAIKLLDGFVKAFDSERPPVFEFRKARQQAAASMMERGFGWGSGSIAIVAKNVTSYLQEKADFIWAKSKEVVNAIAIEPYPKLSEDLKLQVAICYGPTLKAAEQEMEELQQSINAPKGYMIQIKAGFDNILVKINAEVDLFCAAYVASKKQNPQENGGQSIGSQVFNIQNVNGIAGNVLNSQVAVGKGAFIASSFSQRTKQVEALTRLRMALHEEEKKADSEAKPKISEVAHSVQQAETEMKEQDSPEPRRIHKWLETAKYSIKALGLTKEVADAAKAVWEAFGISF